MQNRNAITVPAGQLRQAKTCPAAGPAPAEAVPAASEAWSGRTVAGYEIGKQLAVGGESTVYESRSEDGRGPVIKVYKGPQRDRSRFYRILQEKNLPGMPRLCAYGSEEGQSYECMAFLCGKSLSDQTVFAEKEVRTVLLPQLVRILHALHSCGLLHNDLKPENLIWDENSKRLYLVDFGNLTDLEPELSRGLGVTLSYAAPEILTSRGRAWSIASEICALGLTIYTLLTGQRLIPEGNLFQTKLCWQREMDLEPVPQEMRQLLRRMLCPDPKDRISEKELLEWVGEREQSAPAEKEAAKLTVKFHEEELITPQDLTTAAQKDWEYLSFLLQQHQLDAFLRQTRKDAYALCEQCIRNLNSDAGLFELLQTLNPGEEFVWRGRLYHGLKQLVLEARREEEEPQNSTLAAFCCSGAMVFYCRSNGYAAERIAYMQEMETFMRKAPEQALTQLERAFGVRQSFVCGGREIHTMQELTAFLQARAEDLDAGVAQLVQAEGFRAWMHGKDLEAVLPRAECWTTVMQENEARALRGEPV